ncbi:MAG: ABC transporter ATP-binding protein [Culicoidibacterales bacterium]
MRAHVSVQALEKYYGKNGALSKALNGLSFEMEAGEFVGIMGPSGSGKTTVLNCLATIERPTAGKIWLNQQELTTLKRKELEQFRRDQLGFIFQEYNLIETLTAFENIALALTIQGRNLKNIAEEIAEVAQELEITDILAKFPHELSGGQKQRVAVARAVITKPSLILADEPTGALDSKAAQKLLQTFTQLNQQFHATILMVTHDPVSASYANRIIFIKDGAVFTEIHRGLQTRDEFFQRIMQVAAVLGGSYA